MTAFEDFVNLELPRRSAFLTYEITSYDGDPNSGSAPAILQGAPKGTWFLQQTGSIYWRKRTSAADSWVISNIDATFEEMDIYVRASDGDDSNPGTSALPLETLQAAIDKIPQIVNHTVIIHVGPHFGSGYTQPIIRGKTLNANIYLWGDGGGGVTDGFTEIIGSTSALAGSDETVVVTSGLGTTQFGGFGQRWGATIEILTGDASGDLRTIKYNTATEIFPNTPFSATVAENDTYRIVIPETVIYTASFTTVSGAPIFIDSMSSTDRLGVGAKSNNLYLVNLYFKTGSGGYHLYNRSSTIVFLGVYFDKDIHFAGANNLFLSGIDNLTIYNETTVEYPVNDLGVPNNRSWVGWGLVSFGSTKGLINLLYDNVYQGCVNARYFRVLPDCTAHFFHGCMWGANPFDGKCLSIYEDAKVIIELPLGSMYVGSQTATTNAIENRGLFSSFVFSPTPTSELFISSTGDAIKTIERGITQLFDFTVNGTKVTSTSGIGMVTKNGGSIEIGSNVPQIVASSGDFSINNGQSIHAASELTSPSVFSNQMHGKIYRD